MLKNFIQTEFDVILLGGQSNAWGIGLGDSELTFTPHGDILQMNDDFTITEARENVYNGQSAAYFSLTFAEEYIKSGLLKPGRKALIVRSPVSGTGFSDGRWGPRDDLYLRMMEMAKAALGLNPGNRLAAFLWHQGETDVINKVSYGYYYGHLSALLKSVRDTFGVPNLPFVAGNFVEQWRLHNVQAEGKEPVIRALRDVCAPAGNARFVETDGLASNDQKTGNGDDIHFSREALYIMGERYFEAFRGIVNGDN